MFVALYFAMQVAVKERMVAPSTQALVLSPEGFVSGASCCMCESMCVYPRRLAVFFSVRYGSIPYGSR